MIDEADSVGDTLWNLLNALPGSLRPRVHALIACRDSDWLSSKASALQWSSATVFTQKELEGLNQEDAAAIVGAWTAFGDAGLGGLGRVAEDARVATLIANARDEMTNGAREAFFGALLIARHGRDLENHVRLLLQRLGARKIVGDRTRRDAFALVAAMHAEGFPFLSRAVLARALDCPFEQLHQRVIYPLGREAAATSTSTYVLARHRRVAETAVRLLEQEFGVDFGGVFVELAAAAVDTRHGGRYVPNLRGWRYDVPKHFLATDRSELAIEIARTVVEHDPEDVKGRVNLAYLYRQAGDAAMGAELLRESVNRAADSRGYYTEWGICEEVAGDIVSGVTLLAYSISDQASQQAPTVEDAQVVLNILALALGLLYEATEQTAFRVAQTAVAVVGIQLPRAPRSYFEQYLEDSPERGGTAWTTDDAFDLVANGVALAARKGVNETVSACAPLDQKFTFEALKRVVTNASSQMPA